MAIGELAREVKDVGTGIFYLPGIGLAYLYFAGSETAAANLGLVDPSYLVLSIVSFVAAVILQQFEESTVGSSSSPSGLISRDSFNQRVKFTLFGAGDPNDYSESWIVSIPPDNVKVSWDGCLRVILILTALISLLLLFPYAMWAAFTQAIESSDVIAATIGFMIFVSILKLVTPRIFPSTYHIDKFERPSIHGRLNQFWRFTFDSSSPLTVVGFKYGENADAEVHITYMTKAEGYEEELDVLRTLAFGSAGIISPGEVPTNTFRFTAKEGEGEVAQFSISDELLKEYREGSIMMNEVIEELIHSIEFLEDRRECAK